MNPMDIAGSADLSGLSGSTLATILGAIFTGSSGK